MITTKSGSTDSIEPLRYFLSLQRDGWSYGGLGIYFYLSISSQFTNTWLLLWMIKGGLELWISFFFSMLGIAFTMDISHISAGFPNVYTSRLYILQNSHKINIFYSNWLEYFIYRIVHFKLYMIFSAFNLYNSNYFTIKSDSLDSKSAEQDSESFFTEKNHSFKK